MYSNISIIGVGALGGYLAKNLSDLDSVDSLTIFDYDTVEVENLKNSIYTHQDIGKLKAEAILDKLNPKTKVQIISKKFIEGETILPKSDLVIDCRDFVYDRKETIDARLYISLKNLVIDCRKNVKYDVHHEGKYLEKLNRVDVNNAAFHTTLLVHNRVIKQLIDSQMVHQIYLDYSTEITKKIIHESKNKLDVVYDYNSNDKKLLNIHESSKSILKSNLYEEIIMYLGSSNLPYKSKKIKIKEFKTIKDIVSGISNFLSDIPKSYYNYYIISFKKIGDKSYIEIIPETGAA